MLIVDAHLDLAMNVLVWNRDLKRSAHETRELEAGMTQKGRGGARDRAGGRQAAGRQARLRAVAAPLGG
jgi:hypothetical protein